MEVKDHSGKAIGCRACGSKNLRYSERVQVLDLFWWLFGRHALRCRECRKRFYVATDEAANKIWVKK